VSLWPWPSAEAEPVAADQPVPKYTKWRRVSPPPPPMPCDRCKVDARGAHILVGNGHYCLACGIREAGKAQR
jgi:hypothetical protein